LKKPLYADIIDYMTKEIQKTYESQEVEDKIYETWEKSGYFNPDKCIGNDTASEKSPHFSIVLPPPNVTGDLHIGHAIMLAIQDILIRFHRMKGERTLWLPGTDHAAIATQEKVERILYEKEGKTRHDLGREEFLKIVEKFAEDSRNTIISQIKKMGSSVDWSREAYTLDQERNLAVNTAFKKMYDDRIIYRGHRIVNWDPKLKTTVSDDELERKEEKTTLYYLKYGPFVIATARPETKFGDKYVVMHPKDKRYDNYKNGQKVELEWINGPVMATIIKDECIDMKFGTGVMTITPWHDSTDFQIAERHKLDKEQIIDLDGNLLSIAGEFEGKNISEARNDIVAKMESKGLIVKKDNDYIHEIAINSRGKGIIEPQIMEQWFVGVNKEFSQKGKKTTLKKLMQEAVKSGKIEIIPNHFEKTYFHWIDNLRDWCISRQIWYGHRIPVWYKGNKVYCDINSPSEEGWTQDPDTLDTWFSSGLWTFSTLGWPQNSEDLKDYHPTSVMETGYDILFFWVARMILMSGYLLNDIPFKKVYLHGLIRDEKGRKMSKSLGNAIDPTSVSQKYGTDAVRLSLVIGNSPGNDLRLNEEKITGFRNFANKIWNISRYVLMSIPENIEKEIKKENLSLFDKWIIGKFSNLIADVSDDLDNFRFSQAGEKLREFTWNKFADWYLEISKFEKTLEKEKILIMILKDLLKLWHPFMPFVTEHIWSNVLEEKNLLMIEKWPESNYSKFFGVIQSDIEKAEMIINLISKAREIRTSAKVKPADRKNLFVCTKDKNLIDAIQRHKELIMKLRTGIENLEIIDLEKKIGRPAYRTIKPGILNIQVPLDESEIENERNSIQNGSQGIADVEKYLSIVNKQLENTNLSKKEILKREKTKKNNEAKLPELKKRLSYLN
jgi:valyl-tRNA synthetase